MKESQKRPRVAVIIGAGDATGGAIARRFSREGYVTVVIRRRLEALAPLVEIIQAEGGQVHGFGCDARDEKAMIELFKHVEDQIGDIEVVVFKSAPTSVFPLLRPPNVCTEKFGKWPH